MPYPCATLGTGINSVGGATTTSLTSNTTAELADETILMSKFCTPSRVRGNGNEGDMGDVEVELEHNRLPALQPVNWCRTMKRQYI